MSPDKRKKVEETYHEIVSASENEREKLLSEIKDEEIRREVESLLSFENVEDSFIDNALNGVATRIWDKDFERNLSGKKIGEYKVISLIGAGGMGEVYLAEDTALDRQVALKILPKNFTKNPERLQRFQREAKSISSINHPNIVTIHQIGQEDDLYFIVTELIEGKNLREYLLEKKPNSDEILDILIQITSALKAAHEKGIIHRDIKPENIMVRPDGIVKVLDFGIAKLKAESKKDTTKDKSFVTEPGKVIGTQNYMSPEQALGKEIDERSDIFSFGIVLYETATGSLPFQGDSDAAFFDSLLNHEPKSFDEFEKEIPPSLENVTRRTLQKEPEKRYQTISDLQNDLINLKRNLEADIILNTGESFVRKTDSIPKTSNWRKQIAFLLVAVIGFSAIAFLAFNYKNLFGLDQNQLKNLELSQLTDMPGRELFASISPDGKNFIYTKEIEGITHIFSQRVGGQNPLNLTKDEKANNTQPTFSFDGEKIAFRSERDGGGIFVMEATGESVKRVSDEGYYPAWSPDGSEIVYCFDNFLTPIGRSTIPSPLWAVNIETGKKRLITKQDAVQPNWSPNGKRIAFWKTDTGGQRDILTIAADGSKEPVQVTNDAWFDWNPVWSPDGKSLFFASDRSGSMTFWQVAIDEETGETLGEPKAIVMPTAYSQHLSFARNANLLVYVSRRRDKNIRRIEFDSQTEEIKGNSIEITKGTKFSTIPKISPDGEWIAFTNFGDKQEDIFIIRKDGSGLRRLTNDIYKDRVPAWSPNGKQLVFFSDRSGRYETWKINADGSGLRQLSKTQGGRYAQTSLWSPDGTKILVNTGQDFPILLDPQKEAKNQTPIKLSRDKNPKIWVMMYDWSSDGKTLIGYKRRNDKRISGILEYSFAEKKYTHLTDFGFIPKYLMDNRRVLFVSEDKLYLLDSKTKETKEIFSVEPNRVDGFSITSDDRYIYYSEELLESDIWLAKFDIE